MTPMRIYLGVLLFGTFDVLGLAVPTEFAAEFGLMLPGATVNRPCYTWLVIACPLVLANPFIGVAPESIAGMFINFAISRWIVIHRQDTHKSRTSPV